VTQEIIQRYASSEIRLGFRGLIIQSEHSKVDVEKKWVKLAGKSYSYAPDAQIVGAVVAVGLAFVFGGS
jgi:hypothetical protein